jgi:hypothetical protein
MVVIADHDQAKDYGRPKAIGNNIYNRWLIDVALVTFP